MDQPVWKHLNFWTFSTPSFNNLEKHFLALECHKKQFTERKMPGKKR